MHRRHGKLGYMAIKLDLEKVYDRLKWPFIQETLEEAKIPPQIIAMIMKCICNTKFNILWHREKTDDFLPSRGVRQGDPL